MFPTNFSPFPFFLQSFNTVPAFQTITKPHSTYTHQNKRSLIPRAFSHSFTRSSKAETKWNGGGEEVWKTKGWRLPLNGVRVGYPIQAFPADVVGHGDFQLVPEAR